jgi:hypothetical protein
MTGIAHGAVFIFLNCQGGTHVTRAQYYDLPKEMITKHTFSGDRQCMVKNYQLDMGKIFIKCFINIFEIQLQENTIFLIAEAGHHVTRAQ